MLVLKGHRCQDRFDLGLNRRIVDIDPDIPDVDSVGTRADFDEVINGLPPGDRGLTIATERQINVAAEDQRIGVGVATRRPSTSS